MQPLDARAFGFLFDQRQHHAAQADTAAVREQHERAQQPVRSFALDAAIADQIIGLDAVEDPARLAQIGDRQAGARQEEGEPVEIGVVDRRRA